MKKETVRAGSLKEIKIAALMMLVFGFAEVVSGMTHRFLALTIENSRLAAVMGVTIGLLYLASGLLLLNGK
ncbi:MAG TPA: hypothetical protein VN963_10625, partial [bacterium]|nr:hypothetical protein [bacterium]